MRWVTVLLATALLLLQWPLWLGERSLLAVHRMHRQQLLLDQQNARDEADNLALQHEAEDLRNGLQAVQDRARRELGMIKPDEIFVQILPASAPLPAVSAPKASKQSTSQAAKP